MSRVVCRAAYQWRGRRWWFVGQLDPAHPLGTSPRARARHRLGLDSAQPGDACLSTASSTPEAPFAERPCFHDEYLQAYNEPGVHLIGTNGKGVERIDETGSDEVIHLIELAPDVNAALPVFLPLASVTVARRAEICALRWRHLDQKCGVLHIAGAIAQTPTGIAERRTKTHAERRLTLDDETIRQLAALRHWPKHDNQQRYMFTHVPDGATLWRPDYATRAFARLAAVPTSLAFGSTT